MLFRIVRSSLAVCLLAAAVPCAAQVGRNGSISGQAFAPDHTPIAGASLTLSAPDGPTRPSVTAPDGGLSFPDLPSGNYTIRATAPGFAPLVLAAIPVAVGRTTSIALRFVLASANETVNVAGTPGALDTAQTSSVINIDRDRVEELPIPSRNYLSFVALSPQAAPANPVYAAGTLSGSGGGFGFGGLRPSSNAVRIDGVNDDDEYTGTSRTQLSPEAISDFQIVNHGFAAESGGAAGGAIDVQTRVGVNRLHGDAFVFVQNGALNGTPPLEFTPSKPDENSVRAGVALGGPLQHDKTFYYVAAEQEIAHGQDTNDLRPATLSQINAVLQQPGPLGGLVLQTGFFPTGDGETELSGRLDRTLNARHAAMLRYAFTNTRNVNDAFNTDDLSDRTARGSSFLSDNSLNGTLTSTFSAALLNKFNFELAQRRAVERTGDSVTAGVLIPGAALFGTPYEGNNRRFETHLQFADNLLHQWRKHLFQTGLTVDDVQLRSEVRDGQRGLFVFPTLAAFTAGTPDFYTRSILANPDTNFREDRIGAYVQDHWTATTSLTVDYGLRYDFNHLPAPLPEHPVNLSPRLGLAWTPVPSLVVRSGFGIFYDRFLLSALNRVLELDGVHGFAQVAEGTSAAKIYRTGNPSSIALQPSIWTAPSRLPNPYSEVASFSLEESLPLQTTLKGEYQFVHGVHLGRTTNANLPTPIALTATNAGALGISSPMPQQLGRLTFPTQRLNAMYDANNRFGTSAASSYSGATVTLNRQFTDDFEILAGYTYSKTLDDASYDTEQPQNPYAPADERARSLQDQRHRFTLSGLWLIGPDLNDPQDAAANANPGPLLRALTGLEFAPILSLHSGFRENPVTGLDSNREHIYPFAARPQALSRNSLAAPAILDLDLRVLKMVPVHGGHLDIVAESFNLLNHRNITLLNTAFGSGLTPEATFGLPIGASSARKVQFSLDFEF